MADLTCPQCGAPIAFRSRNLPVRVCDYCHATIMRDGDQLRDAGKAATVPDDVSPLQIGTRGRFQGQGFELVGRVRWRWTDGGWSEWLALRDDGSPLWLGESAGRFMMLRERDPSGTRADIVRLISEQRSIKIGLAATIDDMSYYVTDARAVTCVGCEGELDEPLPGGTKAYSVDLVSDDGRCASIQRMDAETSVYIGRYVSLAELAATNLRAFDDWPMPRYAA